MRFRIALATAMVVTVIPALILTLFSDTPSASARVAHVAVAETRSPQQAAPHQAVALKLNLMSYAEAEKVSRFVTYTQAAELQEEEAYLKVRGLHALPPRGGLPQGGVPGATTAGLHNSVLEQQATVSAPVVTSPQVQSAIPAAWWPTALCEEGGREQSCRRLLRHPRMERLRRLPDRRKRAAVGAVGLGGSARPGTTRRSGAMPRLLSAWSLHRSSAHRGPNHRRIRVRNVRDPAANMAVTCPMSK